MRIEILCTGDEVLTGKITNTNYSYMAQKLEDMGLSVVWGTTVGDDRATLLAAFRAAAARADAVIVNGGLGPTVDDLSQEIAAEAAGVGLEFHAGWFARMEAFFAARSRAMPANNRKQAMLPQGAELLDNPVGTACGFALTIGKARFFFTPGVPRELRRMLDDQILPRLLAMAGTPGIIHLKRFHSYGLGESHVDQLLDGIEAMAADGSVKLGFRAHYPQLETKLLVRAPDAAGIAARLAPVEAEVRRRLGNFILAEDDATLEGNVLAALAARHATLAVVESFTGGQIAARLAPLPGAEAVLRRAVVVRDLAELAPAIGADPDRLDGAREGAHGLALAAHVAEAARKAARASHALAILVDPDPGADGIGFGGAILIGIATETGTACRAARILGGREWLRLGAVEMGLDCLRRHLAGLPIDERIDFEKR